MGYFTKFLISEIICNKINNIFYQMHEELSRVKSELIGSHEFKEFFFNFFFLESHNLPRIYERKSDGIIIRFYNVVRKHSQVIRGYISNEKIIIIVNGFDTSSLNMAPDMSVECYECDDSILSIIHSHDKINGENEMRKHTYLIDKYTESLKVCTDQIPFSSLFTQVNIKSAYK